jgi:hypothetical protein
MNFLHTYYHDGAMFCGHMLKKDFSNVAKILLIMDPLDTYMLLLFFATYVS